MQAGPSATTTMVAGQPQLPAAPSASAAAPPRARSRLTAAGYLAMSLVIVWHTTAMALTLLPDSAVTDAVRKVFAPYITLLRLDNDWGFFAPNVGSGYTLRYVVEDASGKRQAFSPVDDLNRFLPVSIWFRDRYRAAVSWPHLYAGAIGESLCREHADLHPVTITLLSVDQKDFWPEDRRAGKDPLDDEFLTIRQLKKVSCPAT
ncbi:MAG: hypothetical protein AB7K64_08900 [Variibacter sp.]